MQWLRHNRIGRLFDGSGDEDEFSNKMTRRMASARAGDHDAIRPIDTTVASAASPPPSRAGGGIATAVARGGLHPSRRVQHATTGLVLLAISHAVPPYPVGLGLLSIATFAFHRLHRRRVRDEAWDLWYLERFGALLREHERGEWEGVASGARRRRAVPALPGAFYFLLGTTLSALLFPAVVARTSLLVLSIADPAAGLVGACFGEYLNWNVSWELLMLRGRRALLQWGRKEEGYGRSDARSTTEEVGGATVAGSIACALATVLCTYAYIPPPLSGVGIVHDSTTTSAGGEIISLSLGSRLSVGMITAATEAVAGRRLPVIGMRLADDNLMTPLVVGGLIYCWAG
jgi:dolichol kinase